jgi:hypothetical protein
MALDRAHRINYTAAMITFPQLQTGRYRRNDKRQIWICKGMFLIIRRNESHLKTMRGESEIIRLKK